MAAGSYLYDELALEAILLASWARRMFLLNGGRWASLLLKQRPGRGGRKGEHRVRRIGGGETMHLVLMLSTAPLLEDRHEKRHDAGRGLEAGPVAVALDDHVRELPQGHHEQVLPPSGGFHDGRHVRGVRNLSIACTGPDLDEPGNAPHQLRTPPTLVDPEHEKPWRHHRGLPYLMTT